VESLAHLPVGVRIGNTLRGYVGYISKAILPTKLAVFYPLDAAWPISAVVGAGIGLAGVTAMVAWGGAPQAWLVTGWFWYLGTLLHSHRVGAVGGNSMADRTRMFP